MQSDAEYVPTTLLEAVEFAVELVENPRVEGHERAWARLTLSAVPDGWAKVNGQWQRIELVVDQWGRKDAEGNPAPASYVKPPVYRIGEVTDGSVNRRTSS